MHALLELDCIPSGMELFPAANESQWNLIKKVIDDCDYYLLILAGRYGSMNSEGMGYTEMEYRYALSSGKPIIAFLHRDPGKIIADKTEATAEGKQKLQAFRALVEKKHCKHWETAQELGSVVSRSLIQLIKSTPAVGWVRGGELSESGMTTAHLELNRRIQELETELSQARAANLECLEGLAQGEEVYPIHFTFAAIDPQVREGIIFPSSFKPTWNALFACIAPLMIHAANDLQLKRAINEFVRSRNVKRIESLDMMRHKSLDHFEVSDEDFQTITIQLLALGLITKAPRESSDNGYGNSWTLTPYGDQIMMQLRTIKRNEDSSPGATGQCTPFNQAT